TPERKYSVQASVSGNKCDLAIVSWPPVAVRREIKVEQGVSLAMPSKPRKPDDLTLECLKAYLMVLLKRNRKNWGSDLGSSGALRRLFTHHASHGFDKGPGCKGPCHLVSNHLPILHHHNPVRGGKYFTEDVEIGRASCRERV